jgi:hypothetical protein
MSRRSKIWRWAVGLYAFINVAGLGYAAAMDEEMHAMLHLFLLLLGIAGYVGWRLARRGAPEDHVLPAQLPEERIEYLQQSIDAMALELERIGEAQRFSDKLRVEKGEAPLLKKDQ